MSSRMPLAHPPDGGHWLNWLGHKIRYLALSGDTDGTYCFSTANVDSAGGAPPHRHTFDEGFYVLRGTIEFRAGDQTITLQPGEFIHISGNTAHKPTVTSADGAELITIAAPAGFDAFQMEAGEPLESADSQPTKSTQEVRTAIDAIASKYGIEMEPSESAFETTPEIHVCRLGEGDVIDAVGDRYRFLVEAEQSRGLYALWHATISPGGGPPFHTHSREEEAFYVLNGELNFEADGQQFVGGPGTFVNLPKDSKHRFSNAGEENAEVLILVAPAGLEKMFRRTGNPVEDATTGITPPSDDEKKRLVQIAPEYGIELHLGPAH